MSMEQLFEMTKVLRLPGVGEGLTRLLDSPDMASLSFEDKLSFLLDAEVSSREERRRARLEKVAKLKQHSAYVEDINYTANRGIDISQLKSLCHCDWVKKCQHLIISGPTGIGKSWLACSFGNEVIRLGLPVIYKRFSLLIDELDTSRKDGSLPKLRNQLSKAKLLILDDWAMAPLKSQTRQDLLEVIEDRSGQGSLLLTTQLPIKNWHEYIGEPTIADAIMDRIIHRAHRVDLDGPSMRKLKGMGEE